MVGNYRFLLPIFLGCIKPQNSKEKSMSLVVVGRVSIGMK